MLQTATELDLEHLLDNLAPCDWQQGHARTGVECSSEATHLTWQGCVPEVKWRTCERGASWMLTMMHHECRVRHGCVSCHRHIRDCWKVVPI